MQWINDKITNNERFTLDEFIQHSGVDFPLLDELKDCPQDSEWHAEGNVHIHTNMVLQEGFKLCEEYQLSHENKLILILGCIFHDIYKPRSTKVSEINGVDRTVAPRHAEGGAVYLQHRLHQIPALIRNKVTDLVAYHHHPKKIIKNGNPQDFWYITRGLPGKLLYLLEVADIRGRDCDDKDTLLEALEEFKMFCEEYDCYHEVSGLNQRIQFTLDHLHFNYQFVNTRYDFLNGYINDPIVGLSKYYQEPLEVPIVVVMVGISGSGKSSMATLISEEYGIDIINPDANRVGSNLEDRKAAYRISMEQLKVHLRAKRSVIFDATNIRYDSREKIITMTRDYGGLTAVVEVNTPLSVCINNDAKRHDDVSVGSKVIKDQSFKYQYVNEKDFHIWGLSELTRYLDGGNK